MTQTNDIYSSQGLTHTSRHKRPEVIDPVKARADFITKRMIKETETSHGKCDPGTRWVAKLHMCVDKNNIELLKNQYKTKNSSPGLKGGVNSSATPGSKEILRNALREWNKGMAQPKFES